MNGAQRHIKPIITAMSTPSPVSNVTDNGMNIKSSDDSISLLDRQVFINCQAKQMFSMMEFTDKRNKNSINTNVDESHFLIRTIPVRRSIEREDFVVVGLILTVHIYRLNYN